MKTGKILVFCALIYSLTAVSVYAQIGSEIQDLQDSVDTFSKRMAKVLPFNSTIGLNWSDAYIGQLMDVPPRFGIGFSAGVTFVDINIINELLDEFDGGKINSSMGLPLPGYTIDVRIGGFALPIPFDVGIKIGLLDTTDWDFMPIGIEYLLFGLDFRYLLLDSESSPVKISVGLGFNHLRGGISTNINAGQKLDFLDDDTGIGYSITFNDPSIGLSWQSNVVEFKAHASLPLSVLTPYMGAGLSLGWSRVGYIIKADMEFEELGLPTDLDDTIKELLGAMGISNISTNGFDSMVNVFDWNMRLYWGFSINIVVVKFDFTAMYSLRDAGFGATLGLRFQL